MMGKHDRSSVLPDAIRDQVREAAQVIAQQAIKQAALSAFNGKSGGKHGKRRGHSRDAAATVDDVTKHARDAAFTAAALVLDRWQVAGKKVEHGIERGQRDLLEPARETVHTIERRARDAGDDLGDLAEELAGRALQLSRQAADTTAATSRHAADRAADLTREAAEVTVSTARGTTAFIFWTGAASAIVLYAFMDERRRERVFDFAKTVVREGRALIRDIQGEDDLFRP